MTSQNAQVSSGNELENCLRDLLAEHENFPAGRLQLIGMENLKEHFGKRWEQIADKVHTLTQRIISHHLTSKDLYLRCGDFGYCMFFPTLTKAEAKIRSTMIGNEISKQLIGTDDSNALAAVKTFVIDVDGSLVQEEGNLLDALTDLIDQSAAAEAEDKEIEEEDWGDIIMTDGFEMPDGIRFAFSPVWDVSLNAVSTYRMRSKVEISPDVWQFDYDFIPDDVAAQKLYQEQDIRNVNYAHFSLKDAAIRNQKYILSCPVHFESLRTNDRLLAYTELLKEISEELRKFLVLEVFGLTDSMPQSRMQSFLPTLSKHCRAVMIQLPLETASLTNFRGIGIHAVGATVRSKQISEAKAFSALDRFAMNAAKSSLKCSIYGLDSFSLATAGIAAGFNYIDGAAVKEIMPEPGEVQRFGTVDLIKSAFN